MARGARQLLMRKGLARGVNESGVVATGGAPTVVRGVVVATGALRPELLAGGCKAGWMAAAVLRCHDPSILRICIQTALCEAFVSTQTQKPVGAFILV